LLDGFHEMDEISASRHSSATWCLLAVWLPELESKTEPELGHESSTACLIRGYRQLKDKKVMNIGYDKPLYLQPFDHRGSFQTKMFGWKGKLTEEQTAQIAAAKQVIYDGFKVAVAAGVPKEKAGILVDEQFGAAILRDAAAHAYLTACPVEKSGQDEFDFDYGEDFAKHIEAFRPTLSKVLVRYNPEGDEALNQRQSSRLRRLSDYLHTESHRLFMFELLVPAEKAQLDRVKGDKKAYDLELRPGLMAQAIESSRMQELRRTSGKSRDSTVARIARGLWRLRIETAGTKLAAFSSAGARTTRRCTNG
jgi:Uncharacterized protein conserved in bacteria (DUF2090)